MIPIFTEYIRQNMFVRCLQAQHVDWVLLDMQDNANDVLGIDPDVRQLVYTQAVANGGAASYNIMQGLYLSVSCH